MGKTSGTPFCVNAHCSLDGAVLNVGFDASQISSKLQAEIEKKLMKKGIRIAWNGDSTGANLKIRFVEMDQGNQFLRWLLPFISPAVMELEGEFALAGAEPVPFHCKKKAHIGVFGGSGQGMLTSCAAGLAGDIASIVTRQIGL